MGLRVSTYQYSRREEMVYHIAMNLAEPAENLGWSL